MMTATLKMTSKELDKLVNRKLNCERFEKIFDDIPMYHPDHVQAEGERHYDYEEDDGRQYRWYIFKDTVTGVEHCLNYTYNKEWPNDIMDTPESIEVVANEEDSDLYVKPIPVLVPEQVLTPEAQADKDLWAKYQVIKPECVVVQPKEKLSVPKAVIDDILNFLKTEKFNAFQLRAKIVPVCIEYKIEDVSFWRWIQVKRKVWKA
jgi:hypothetical protein